MLEQQVSPSSEAENQSKNISALSNTKQRDTLKKRRSILVIDDAETIRFFLKTTLASEGFNVFEADTAENGLKQLKSEPIDLALLDLGLPDADGLEVLEKLNYKEPNLPVVIFTVRDDRETKQKAFNLGARDYITKPFDIDDLLDSITSILACDPNKY